MVKLLFLLLIAAALCFSQDVSKIKLPAGFSISLLASVPRARQMAVNSANTMLYIASPFDSNPALLALPIIYENGKGYKKNGELKTIKTGLNNPIGVAYDSETGDVFVSEVQTVYRFKDLDGILASGGSVPTPQVFATFPSDSAHGGKYLKLFGSKLFVPQGSPCNICNVTGVYGTIHMFNKQDGSGKTMVAQGIRNTVGFDMNPRANNELWFTDNGRDSWGDNSPGDELNKIPNVLATANHYGFPFCYDKDLVDPEFNTQGTCQGYTPCEYVLGPHVASLGMTFYRGSMFPSEYQDHPIIFIAEHGSWDRSQRIGYRVTMVNTSIADGSAYKVFAEGWLEGQNYWGRPVDVLNLKDGSLLVSDDYAGAIYRIAYGSPTPVDSAASQSTVSSLILLLAAVLLITSFSMV